MNLTGVEREVNWGLGRLVKERRDKASTTPIEVLMKLHKTPIASRPADRAFNSQMKPIVIYRTTGPISPVRHHPGARWS